MNANQCIVVFNQMNIKNTNKLMTLKEKLNEKLSEAFANEIEQIADEFAIGFGQWLVSNCYSEDDMYWWLIKTNGDVENVTIKELLEIYKKEKGL